MNSTYKLMEYQVPNSPTKIIFGRGKLKRLADFFPADVQSVLVVTGKHSSKENGSLALLQKFFKKTHKGLTIFDEVEQNPSIDTVNKGASLALQKKPDLVIGLGGGSAMDAAKCIAMLATNDGAIEEYLGDKTASKAPLPIMAIPTTAGTGSEVTPYAVLTLSSLNTKKAYSSEQIFPKMAVLDPELTISMSREITVNTGVDALTHAIEGCLSTQATQSSDKLAFESIKKICQYLPQAAAEGRNIESRTQMLYASLLAGLVIAQTKTILLHALGYPLTAFYNIPHGKANGILLPYVLEFLKDTQGDKIAKVSAIFGNQGINSVCQFVNNLDIATSLKDYGINRKDITQFVEDVWGRKNLEVTLKKVKRKDITNIYEQAM